MNSQHWNSNSQLHNIMCLENEKLQHVVGHSKPEAYNYTMVVCFVTVRCKSRSTLGKGSSLGYVFPKLQRIGNVANRKWGGVRPFTQVRKVKRWSPYPAPLPTKISFSYRMWRDQLYLLNNHQLTKVNKKTIREGWAW